MTTLFKKGALPPEIFRLPGDALLSRNQLAQLSGYSVQTFKAWAKKGRGPRVIYVEGRPRTMVQDYRAWISGMGLST